MREGSDALLVTTGITLKLALEAAAALEGEGIQAAVLHVPTVKPLDALPCWIILAGSRGSCRGGTQVIGGLGSAVAELIAEADFPGPKRFRRIGIPDVFPDQYGSQASLMERYEISAASRSRRWSARRVLIRDNLIREVCHG